jgi:hypothetical protein
MLSPAAILARILSRNLAGKARGGIGESRDGELICVAVGRLGQLVFFRGLPYQVALMRCLLWETIFPVSIS